MAGNLYGMDSLLRGFRNASGDGDAVPDTTSVRALGPAANGLALLISGIWLAVLEVISAAAVIPEYSLGLFGFTTSHVIFAFVFLTIAVWIIGAGLRHLGKRGSWLGWGALAGLSLLIFLTQGHALFQGDAFQARGDADLIETAFLLFGSACLVVSFLIAKKTSTARRLLAFSLLSLLASSAVLFLDARLWTGNYPAAHNLMALTAVLTGWFAWSGFFRFFELEPRSKPLQIETFLVLCLIVAGVSVHLLRRADSAPRWRASALAPAFPLCRKMLPELELRGLDRISPLATIETDLLDHQAWIEAVFAPPSPEVISARDAWAENSRPENIVVIALDTVRADLLGDNRAQKGLTPNLDRFSKEALIFERGYTPYPTSNYAYSSTFTGVWPRYSPARRITHKKEGIPEVEPLPRRLQTDGWQTLAQTGFNDLGVDTPALFGHLRDGFDAFNPKRSATVLDAAEVTESALELIENRDPNRSMFLFVHYMDAHAPYRVHEAKNRDANSFDRYCGEIAHVDRNLGPLLQRLSQGDLASNTAVVIVADHGEAFRDHNTRFHNSSLYEEQIRVPFYFRLPGVASRRIQAAVSLVDIAPTLRSLLGLPSTEFVSGRDLSPLIFQDASRNDQWIDLAYAERFPLDPLPGRTLQRALILGKNKIIHYTNDPSPEIYDLEADPKETRNLFDPGRPEHQELVGRLAALDAAMKERADPKPKMKPQLTPERVARFLRKMSDPDPAGHYQAVVDFAKYLYVGHRKRFDDSQLDAIDPADRRRLIEAMQKIFAGENEPLDARAMAFEVLSDLDDDMIASTMALGLKSPSEFGRARAARWFALRGDDRGRRELLETFGPQHPNWSLLAAPALAKLGEIRALPWLEAALIHEDLGYAQRALQGLNDLAWPELARTISDILVVFPSVWQRPALQLEAIEVLARNSKTEATLALARLSFSIDAKVQVAASRELSQRMPADRLELLLKAVERQVFGEEFWRAFDFAQARAEFEASLKQLAAMQIEAPRIQLATARLEWLLEDRAAADGRLKKLLAGESPPWIKRDARSLQRVASGPGATLPLAPIYQSLKFAWVGDEVLPDEPNIYFTRVLDVTNTSSSMMIGGIYPDGLRLGLDNRRAGEREYHRADPGRFPLVAFLPPEGLAPGQSCRVFLPASSAESKGDFETDLILSDRPWNTERQDVLTTLEKP